MRQREEGHVTEAWTLRRGLQAAKEVAEDAAEEAAQAFAAREEAEKREKRAEATIDSLNWEAAEKKAAWDKEKKALEVKGDKLKQQLEETQARMRTALPPHIPHPLSSVQ